jgi:hypothetical protein
LERAINPYLGPRVKDFRESGANPPITFCIRKVLLFLIINRYVVHGIAVPNYSINEGN